MSVGRGFTPAAKSYSIEVSMFILFSQGLLVVAASPRACPGSPRGVTPTPVLARSPIFIFDHAGVPHPDRAGVLTEHVNSPKASSFFQMETNPSPSKGFIPHNII